MIRNYSFNYSILIYDGTFTIEVKNSSLRTLSFQPVELLEYGTDFLPSNIGEVLFWCKILDPFDEHEALLSVFDDDNQSWILEEALMISNETNHYFFVPMNYSQNYTYKIEVRDNGSIRGLYDSSEGFGLGQMEDNWRPIIHDSGMDPINDTLIVCWANVSDWGSGIQEVFLKYEFISGENSGGGSSIQVINVPMKFNGSLYLTELIINQSGTFQWSIEAYDAIGSSTSHSSEFSVFPPGSIAYSPEEIIIFISIALILLGIPLYVVRTIRVRRSVKFKRIKKIEDKLATISNVYTILLTTEVGVPVYTVSNIIYQKDQNLADVLSGVSVSIDTFLQSFQADFMQQVQLQDSEISETVSGIDIRMSVIEQHEVQVLILATHTYRLFVFLREQPSKFTRDAFYKAIGDLEKNIHIQDVGIVDERVYEPHVELILQKYFPLTLLEPFVIDTIKLQRFDEGIKRGRSDVPLSSPVINSLKRLVVAHTLSKGKESNFDKIFNEAVKNGSLLESRMLLYNDAKEIMTKLLKIPPQQIYEALWIGSAPDVRVIIPQRV